MPHYGEEEAAKEASNIGRPYASGGAAKLQPPRTLDSLNGIVGRLKATRRQIEGMLDRFNPQPQEADVAQIGQILGGQPYAASIGDIESELNRIGALLDNLERHV